MATLLHSTSLSDMCDDIIYIICSIVYKTYGSKYIGILMLISKKFYNFFYRYKSLSPDLSLYQECIKIFTKYKSIIILLPNLRYFNIKISDNKLIVPKFICLPYKIDIPILPNRSIHGVQQIGNCIYYFNKDNATISIKSCNSRYEKKNIMLTKVNYLKYNQEEVLGCYANGENRQLIIENDHIEVYNEKLNNIIQVKFI
jgi:hypothetical protein